MSQNARQIELREETRRLLQGALKHVRATALATALVPLASVAVTPAVASAQGSGGTGSEWTAPSPCDFTTSGGDVVSDVRKRMSFGAHGGCKNGELWGHVNFVDQRHRDTPGQHRDHRVLRLDRLPQHPRCVWDWHAQRLAGRALPRTPAGQRRARSVRPVRVEPVHWPRRLDSPARERASRRRERATPRTQSLDHRPRVYARRVHRVWRRDHSLSGTPVGPRAFARDPTPHGRAPTVLCPCGRRQAQRHEPAPRIAVQSRSGGRCRHDCRAGHRGPRRHAEGHDWLAVPGSTRASQVG